MSPGHQAQRHWSGGGVSQSYDTHIQTLASPLSSKAIWIRSILFRLGDICKALDYFFDWNLPKLAEATPTTVAPLEPGRLCILSAERNWVSYLDPPFTVCKLLCLAESSLLENDSPNQDSRMPLCSNGCNVGETPIECSENSPSTLYAPRKMYFRRSPTAHLNLAATPQKGADAIINNY